MRVKPRQGAHCRHYDRIPSENIIKQNKSRMRGGNSEEIATGVSTRVIAMLTDVATAQRQDLAPSRTPESAPSHGMIIATRTGRMQRSSAT